MRVIPLWLLLQQLRKQLRIVRDDQIRPGPLDRDQRLHHRPLPVDPPVFRRRLTFPTHPPIPAIPDQDLVKILPVFLVQLVSGIFLLVQPM